MFRSGLAICIAALCTLTPSALLRCQAPAHAPSRISGEDLAADLGILEHAYESMHPGLLRYNSEAQIAAAFAEARSQLSSGATIPQAFMTLALLSAKVRCGHTYPNFFNQSSSVVDEVLRGKTRIPFYFTWINQRMVVTRDLTVDRKMPVGTEILVINKTPSQTILASLLPYVRADGANDAKRVALLGVSGEAEWEAFDVYYPLLFPLQTETFHFTIKRPGVKPSEVSLPAMTEIDREQIRKAAGSPGPNDAVFSRRVLPSSTEVLRMPSWGLFNSKWDWKTWLDAAFDDAVKDKAPELVLDLRGNEGGEDEIGRYILSRLIAQPLAIQNYARLVRYRTAPTDLEPYLDTWDKSFLRLGVDAQRFTSGLPHLPREEWLSLADENTHAGTKTVLPRKTRYTGKVVVLVDAQNSSATFQFADAVQQNHLGLLLGEPTGGNQRGINGGAFFFLRLPHSKIEMDLPRVGYFAQSETPDAGLRPDRAVPTTARDIAEGRDPQLLAAQALLR